MGIEHTDDKIDLVKLAYESLVADGVPSLEASILALATSVEWLRSSAEKIAVCAEFVEGIHECTKFLNPIYSPYH